jgi:hypothetical protein
MDAHGREKRYIDRRLVAGDPIVDISELEQVRFRKKTAKS